jgi:predicted secreted protein
MAVAGVGTEFRRWNATLGQWEAIAQVNSIGGPDMSVDTIETTALDTTGGAKTFIAGFIDNGSVALEMNFTRDTYEQFLTDLQARLELEYEIIFPDADTTTAEFAALVVGLTVNTDPDDKITMTVDLKISGVVDINSGSGPSAGA